MEPKWNRTSTEMRKMQTILDYHVPKSWYREVGTRTEVPEPAPWNRRNRVFRTKTVTELKNQYRPNTSKKVGFYT